MPLGCNIGGLRCCEKLRDANLAAGQRATALPNGASCGAAHPAPGRSSPACISAPSGAHASLRLVNMIITHCANCATEIQRTAPRCIKCWTRYCGPACQRQHWDSGGHNRQLCKRIKRRGGAEKHNAHERYKEVVATAVSATAEQRDAAGQTCYICLEGFERRHDENEGLVRGCACRGTSGFVHLSCLVRRAETAVQDAFDYNRDEAQKIEQFMRWERCQFCNQEYQGPVLGALGWAAWRAYSTLPAGDLRWFQSLALLAKGLGSGLRDHAAALPVLMVELQANLDHGRDMYYVITTQSAIAHCYVALGRLDEALKLRQTTYADSCTLYGISHESSAAMALNVADSMIQANMCALARSFLCDVLRRVDSPPEELLIRLHWCIALTLFKANDPTPSDLQDARSIYEDLLNKVHLLLGPNHPLSLDILRSVHELMQKHAALSNTEAFVPRHHANGDLEMRWWAGPLPPPAADVLRRLCDNPVIPGFSVNELLSSVRTLDMDGIRMQRQPAPWQPARRRG